MPMPTYRTFEKLSQREYRGIRRDVLMQVLLGDGVCRFFSYMSDGSGVMQIVHAETHRLGSLACQGMLEALAASGFMETRGIQ